MKIDLSKQMSAGPSPSPTKMGSKCLKNNDTNQIPDIKVYVSNLSKAPNAQNSFETFINPGSRMMIKKPERDHVDDEVVLAPKSKQAALR